MLSEGVYNRETLQRHRKGVYPAGGSAGPESVKTNDIKIEWVSCRVCRKTVANRCYRYLGFSHMAVNCRGPDRSRHCWRCGKEEHTARTCSRKPQCYFCPAREDKPRDDHIPGTMRCVAFREEALKVPNGVKQAPKKGAELYKILGFNKPKFC